MTAKTKDTATRKYEDDNKIIEITLTRWVIESTKYFDGYDMGSKTETHEEYKVVLTSKANNAQVAMTGKPGDYAFFDVIDRRYNKNAPAGAYARLNNAYLGQESYDIAMRMIADLSAELSINQEYNALKAAEAALAAEAERNAEAVDRAEAVEAAARRSHPGWCEKCQSYCYGDCDANGL